MNGSCPRCGGSCRIDITEIGKDARGYEGEKAIYFQNVTAVLACTRCEWTYSGTISDLILNKKTGEILRGIVSED